MVKEYKTIRDAIEPLVHEMNAITQVHCNCRHITPDAVRKEVDDLLKLRLADMRELLERNIDTIMVEVGKGRAV